VKHIAKKQIPEVLWESKFARFVRSYGVDPLAARLAIQPSAIYHWIRGATAPRPAHAGLIQRLARQRGVVLTLDQIYWHFLSLREFPLPSEPFPEESARRARPAPRDFQWE
jgi:hypothetical protein